MVLTLKSLVPLLIATSVFFCSLLILSVLAWLWTTKITKKRIHFIEIHEEWWCPVFIRHYVQTSLAYGWHCFGAPKFLGNGANTVANILTPFFKANKFNVILDLCSGGSGYYIFLFFFFFFYFRKLKKLKKNTK